MDSPPLNILNNNGGKNPIVHLRRFNGEVNNVSENSEFSRNFEGSVNSEADIIIINEENQDTMNEENENAINDENIVIIDDKNEVSITIYDENETDIKTNNKNDSATVIINNETKSTIGEGIKFVDAEFITEVPVEYKKKNINVEIMEQKRLDREAYEKKIQEKQYKRLMHLLSQSKALSNYITIRFDEKLNPNNKKSKKRKADLQNYDLSPKKKEKLNQHLNSNKTETYKKSIKVNLSNEKITKELLDMSDEETDDKENISTDIFIQPTFFKGQLRDYQKEGFKWLKVLYENGLNGILADEMGLGKTIQVIALYTYLIEKQIHGPFLIIVPLSTLSNWISEFQRFAPQIPVVECYRIKHNKYEFKKLISKKKYISTTCSTYPVVITTYNEVMYNSNLFASFHWKYLVIDEAQRIKNNSSLLFTTVKRFDSVNRLLLTGTPLQNNLSELWSLLNFLLPDIFNDLAVFESWFDAKQVLDESGKEKLFKQEQEKQVLSTLREILHPFMLRRLKEDVCSDIPLIKEIIIYTPLTKLQYDLYSAVINKSLHKKNYGNELESCIVDIDGVRPKRKCTRNFNKKNGCFEIPNTDSSIIRKSKYTDMDLKEIQTWKKFITVSEENINYLSRLKLSNYNMIYRHIVNHPYIIYNPISEVGLKKDMDDVLKVSGKLLVLDAMLKNLKSNNHKVLLFSTMTSVLDIIEDYLYLRDYKYTRLDGSINHENRTDSIVKFNTDPEVFLFLLTTKAGGVGLNLTAADTVIIYDSDWNPQNDLQAMARCHRIGQTKPVAIYRLCTKGTIDEEIIKRANAKRFLEKAVISKEKNFVDTEEGLLQLKTLLENNAFKLRNSSGKVYTEAELNELLDRSHW